LRKNVRREKRVGQHNIDLPTRTCSGILCARRTFPGWRTAHVRMKSSCSA